MVFDFGKYAFLTMAFFLTCALLFSPGCQTESGQDAYEIFNVQGLGAYANSYIIASQGKAAIIDPGQAEEVIRVIEEKSLSPKVILLTHGHFDHIAGIKEVLTKYPGTQVKVHPADAKKLADPAANVSELYDTRIALEVPTTPLKEGDSIQLGKTSIKVLETPGHTSGSVSFQLGANLFSGDILMSGAVGRTDFPDGNPVLLTDSLNKLKSLPDDTNVLPGHGDPTTIGDEKDSNPFLQ